MLASVFSHKAEIEFIEEILLAKKALATNLESSDDQTFVVTILSLGIQLEYISINFFAALSPDFVFCDPIRTLSDLNKSSIAVPSAKNSGFDKTSKLTPLPVESKMV